MRIKTIIMGASGYVGGELLRLLKNHPNLDYVIAISESHAGENINTIFPHLTHSYQDEKFKTYENWSIDIDHGDPVAIFSAAPHGISAGILTSILETLAIKNIKPKVVDISADFRFSDPEIFYRTYGIKHLHAELLSQFICGIPEHIIKTESNFIAHPGCFATAILLAITPIIINDITDNEFYISAITGSTGSGRSPKKTTHHPERHSNVFAYKPLSHRHAPEIVSICENITTVKPKINFIPHSGPFSRGIYATIQAKLKSDKHIDDAAPIFKNHYSESKFITYMDDTPQLKSVVTSNFCHLSSSIDNDQIVINCAIDNLIKGSAGGSIQWMNRLWELPEETGLMTITSPWI